MLVSMDQDVITTDPSGTITSANSAAMQILGVSSDGVGRPLASLAATGVQMVSLTNVVAHRREAVGDQEFQCALEAGPVLPGMSAR